jgi:hypothetical protein
MQADSFSTPTAEQLQELYDVSLAITEADLREYLDAKERFLAARADLESARANIEESMILGLPIDGDSELTAGFKDGNLYVRPKPDIEVMEVRARKLRSVMVSRQGDPFEE